MNVKELREFYKVESNAQLAQKIKRGRTTIWEWEAKGIPPKTQALLQLQTKGKLKADIQALAS